MTETEGRSTWRTDRYSPCPRRDAGRYLAFLATIGYQLSAIEQAVADGTPYTGDTPSVGLPAAETQPDDAAEPGGDSGDAGQDYPGDHVSDEAGSTVDAAA